MPSTEYSIEAFRFTLKAFQEDGQRGQKGLNFWVLGRFFLKVKSVDTYVSIAIRWMGEVAFATCTLEFKKANSCVF